MLVGIVGYSITTDITYSYNTGTIKGNNYVGGITGENKGNINNCFNLGNIESTTSNCGGIVGLNWLKVQNCYNTADITGTGTNIGGIVGYMKDREANVKNCYNVGNITGSYGGGIVGTMTEGKIESSYYLENKVNGENGQDYAGTEVKTSDEIKEIYTELGNSFKEDSNNINNGFPILSWQ